jgi:biopolymer transport protein TolR
MLTAVAQENLEKRVYVRGDRDVAYGRVMAVLSLLQTAGFTNAAMVVDPNSASRDPEGG